MNIVSTYKLGKIKAKIFVLCGLKIRNMTWLFLGIWLAQQGISMSIEFLLFGDLFPHAIDSIFTIFISTCYFYYVNELGDFLLDLHLNGKVQP